MHEIKHSLSLLPPNGAESLAIHEMFKQTIDLKSGSLNVRHKPANAVWMGEAKLKNALICHPEQRNLYNKIFGGGFPFNNYDWFFFDKKAENSTIILKSKI